MRDRNYYINVFENFKNLILRKTAEINLYGNWLSDFSVEEIKTSYTKLHEAFDDIDYTIFYKSELIEKFGFSMWDDDLILIPLWAIKTIKEKTVLYTINNEKIIATKDNLLSTDSRFGMTAYGFKTSQLRDGKLNAILDDTITTNK